MKRTFFIVTTIIVTSLGFFTNLNKSKANDNKVVAVADGKTLYTQKLCASCHGADGKAPIAPMYPKLAGQSKTYLINQTKDIRDGKRKNGMSSAMQPMTSSLTDAEITAIADYLSKVK